MDSLYREYMWTAYEQVCLCWGVSYTCLGVLWNQAGTKTGEIIDWKFIWTVYMESISGQQIKRSAKVFYYTCLSKQIFL